MKCTVPELEVPPKFKTVLAEVNISSASPVYTVDDETLTFYAGVVLDGYDKYRYIDESSPGFTTVEVNYIPPTVEEFDDIVYFDPEMQISIKIKVNLCMIHRSSNHSDQQKH